MKKLSPEQIEDIKLYLNNNQDETFDMLAAVLSQKYGVTITTKELFSLTIGI